MLGGYVGLVDSHLRVPQEMPLGGKEEGRTGLQRHIILSCLFLFIYFFFFSLSLPFFFYSSSSIFSSSSSVAERLLCVAYGISSTQRNRHFRSLQHRLVSQPRLVSGHVLVSFCQNPFFSLYQLLWLCGAYNSSECAQLSPSICRWLHPNRKQMTFFLSYYLFPPFKLSQKKNKPKMI